MKTYSFDELCEKTVTELRELCLKVGIAGMSKRRKDDIVEALEEYYAKVNKPVPSSCCKETPKKSSKVSSTTIVSMTAHLSGYLNPDSKTNDDKYITNVSVSCGAASGNFWPMASIWTRC